MKNLSYSKKINELLNVNLIILLIGSDSDININIEESDLEEESDEKIMEGLLKEYKLNKFERSSFARKKCLEYYQNRIVCQVCGFDFDKQYGKRENGIPYIEIHHIQPLAARAQKEGCYKVDYTKDLIPLCANCHRMIHYFGNEPLHPSVLKKLFETNQKSNSI